MSNSPTAPNSGVDVPPVRPMRATSNARPTVVPLHDQGAPPVRQRRLNEPQAEQARPPVIVRATGGSARRAHAEPGPGRNEPALDRPADAVEGAVVDPLRVAARRAHEGSAGSGDLGFMWVVVGAALGSFTVVALLAGWLIR